MQSSAKRPKKPRGEEKNIRAGQPRRTNEWPRNDVKLECLIKQENFFIFSHNVIPLNNKRQFYTMDNDVIKTLRGKCILENQIS